MTVKDLHKKAMEYNDKAIIAVSKGRTAKSYYKKAFECEKKACLLFASSSDAEPTRSVLLRSAASLAMMAGLPEEAEKMIAIGLAGNPPKEILKELRFLNIQICNELLFKRAKIEIEIKKILLAYQKESKKIKLEIA